MGRNYDADWDFASKDGKKSSHFIRNFILLVLCITVGTLGGLFWSIYTNTVPVTDSQLQIKNFSSVVYDMTGKTEIITLNGNEKREWANLTDLPENMTKTILAAQDPNFKTHQGVDYPTLGMSLYNTLLGKEDSQNGGSTITMQLVRNVTHDDSETIQRKVREMICATQLEKKLKKDQILELYLNSIYFGEGSYGVKSASKTYFSKYPKDLTLAECAALAAISDSPSNNDLLTEKGATNNKTHREQILQKMKSLGLIDQNACNSALQETIQTQATLKTDNQTSSSNSQNAFVDTLKTQVIADLVKSGLYDKTNAEILLFNGGLKIYSTMDINAQKVLDKVLSDTSNYPSQGQKPVPLDKASQDTTQTYKLHAAMTLMDPTTGEIRAIACGPNNTTDNATEGTSYNYATSKNRNPGSLFTPLAVYAPALDLKLVKPTDMIDTVALYLNPSTPKVPYPKETTKGYPAKVSVKNALAMSLVTPTMRVWQKMGDVNKVNTYLSNLGFPQTHDANVVSFPLGGVLGTSTFEITSAYATFANKGIYNEPITYLKVVDRQGKVLLDRKNSPNVKQISNTVFTNANTVPAVLDMLKAVTLPGGTAPYVKVTNKQNQSIPLAGKTGTSDGEKDRWFAGLTPYYVGSVWFGDEKTLPLPSLVPNPAAKMWMDVMNELHQTLAAKDF